MFWDILAKIIVCLYLSKFTSERVLALSLWSSKLTKIYIEMHDKKYSTIVLVFKLEITTNQTINKFFSCLEVKKSFAFICKKSVWAWNIFDLIEKSARPLFRINSR